MTNLESLIVTGLGMGVVFIGLLLCILSIQLFNRLARRVTWGDEGQPHDAPPSVPVPASRGEAPAAARSTNTELRPPESGLLEPELLAVIAAALEIEKRLSFGNDSPQRLTIRRVSNP